MHMIMVFAMRAIYRQNDLAQYIELLIVITRTMCIYLLNTDKFVHPNMNPFLLTIRSGVSIIKNKKKAG